MWVGSLVLSVHTVAKVKMDASVLGASCSPLVHREALVEALMLAMLCGNSTVLLAVYAHIYSVMILTLPHHDKSSPSVAQSRALWKERVVHQAN